MVEFMRFIQAFSLRLGISALDSPPLATYELDTLEDQQGAKLINITSNKPSITH
jgi:hypothetical protein